MAIKNYLEAPLSDLPNCHDGIGVLRHIGLFSGEEFASPIRFMNYTILPPGTTIGNHEHGNDEEIYVVLEGKGEMIFDGKSFPVKAGAVTVNRPFGTHGIVNTGDVDMRLLVFEVEVK